MNQPIKSICLIVLVLFLGSYTSISQVTNQIINDNIVKKKLVFKSSNKLDCGEMNLDRQGKFCEAINTRGQMVTTTSILKVPFDTPLSHFSFSLSFKLNNIHSHDIKVHYKVLNKSEGWSDWLSLSEDTHDYIDEYYSTNLAFIRPDDTKLMVKIVGLDMDKSELDITFINRQEKTLEPSMIKHQKSIAAPCPKPTVLPRSSYLNPTEEADHGTPGTTSVTHIAIHHADWSTSTANPTWLDVAHAVWCLHKHRSLKETNPSDVDYSDIGYNYLIDPNGVIYEGRAGGEDVIAVSLCGPHDNLMSICMLGDFHLTNQFLTPSSFNSLVSMLAWKVDKENINPLGSGNLSGYGLQPHIMGHQDGCSTACPGDNIYQELDGIRTSVNSRITNCENPIVFTSNIDLTPSCNSFSLDQTTTSIKVENLEISNLGDASSDGFKIYYFLTDFNNTYDLGVQSIATLDAFSNISVPMYEMSLSGIPNGSYNFNIYVESDDYATSPNPDLVEYDLYNNSCLTNIDISHTSATCSDNTQNQGETGIDCGGPCPDCYEENNPCFNGIKDNGETAVDCGGPCSLNCTQTCSDGVKNGYESGIDCGGVWCSECIVPISPCYDGMQNHGETGIDCGGLYCQPCSCTDGTWNGDEAGVDCGGFCDQPCPTCWDGVQNQYEEEIDCGGPCQPCDSCPENLDVTDTNSAGIFKANHTVTGHSAVLGTAGDVQFSAGKKVDLLPGFLADSKHNTFFTTQIEACTNSLVSESVNSYIQDAESESELSVDLEMSPLEPVGDEQHISLAIRNYPNPFIGQTTIEYSLPETGEVTLYVSDITGRKVSDLLQGESKTKGTHRLLFDGAKFPEGLYHYTIQFRDQIVNQKMIIVK